MQLFLGIDLPEEVKNDLYKQLEEMRDAYPDFSWVTKSNYQITIESFGEIHEEKVKSLEKKIEDVLFDQNWFQLYSTDCEITITDKITLYLNVRKERALEQLNEKIRGISISLVPRKKFIGRIVLARYRIPSKQQYFVLKKRFERLDISVEFPVRFVTLFQYQKQLPIKSFPLFED